jgi:Uma2 family endonuclease
MRRMEGLKRRVSFADLQRMPDDGNRYELYDGELRVVPSPLPGHQIVSIRLVEALIEHRRRHGGLVVTAPFDIVLSEHDVVQPDVVYFGVDAARKIRPDQYVRFAPDLAIEIISPSTAHIDRGRKRDLLARYGLRECWLVDPGTRRVEVSVLGRRGYGTPTVIEQGSVDSPTISGFSVSLEWLFEHLL